MLDFILALLLIVGILALLLSFPFLAYFLTKVEKHKNHWWNIMWSIVDDQRGVDVRLGLFFFLLCPMGIFGLLTGVYSLETRTDKLFAFSIAIISSLMLSNKRFFKLHRDSRLAQLSSLTYGVYLLVTASLFWRGYLAAEDIMGNLMLVSMLWGALLFVALIRFKLKQLKADNADES